MSINLPRPVRALALAVAIAAGIGWTPFVASRVDAPPPHPPFTDYRYESPGTSRRITPADLPPPHATASANAGPEIVGRPADALPQAPKGFRVGLYAEGLKSPRVLRVAPNGDVFLAESGKGRLRLFRGLDDNGRAAQSTVWAEHLSHPYGIAFYPPGQEPRWLYVGDTDEVLRFPYRNGDPAATAKPEHVASLPSGGGHWTRDLRFSADGGTLYVGVGSVSNNDDPDAEPDERNRADILAFDADGTHPRIYASGLRNPSGLAIDPRSGQLWCSVNERDGLGDDLVPDYLTAVKEGGFYGWPWWYIGAHQDPRHKGRHAELKDKVIVPDVLLQPHGAPLQLDFYTGVRFPKDYQGDLFATEHGSWNRSVRAGYEVILVPLHQAGKTDGSYEDFLTGFVLPDGRVWGRPVGIATAADGALLVSDDASGSIWRVDYTGN